MSITFPTPNNRVMKTGSQIFSYRGMQIEMYMIYEYDDNFEDEDNWFTNIEMIIDGKLVHFHQDLSEDEIEQYYGQMSGRGFPGELIDVPFDEDFNVLLVKIFDAYIASRTVNAT